MKRPLNKLVDVLGTPLAALAAWLLRWSGRRVGAALVYHSVAAETGHPYRELVPAHGERLFEKQVRHVARHYRVVPASRLLGAAGERSRGERIPIAITFDDDLASHRRLATPVLQRAGVPATFFLCGASLDGLFRFWWETLQVAVDSGLPTSSLSPALDAAAKSQGNELDIHRLAAAIKVMPQERKEAVARSLADLVGPGPQDAGLGAADVRGLVEAGFELGFHTRRHDYLPQLDDAALQLAMREGRDELEALAGGAITTIAYPHGGSDSRVAAAARVAGYSYGFTTRAQAVNPDSADAHLIGRLEPSFSSAGRFALKLVRTLTMNT